MAKSKHDLNSIKFQVKAQRIAERAERVEALRDGLRPNRAATFADRKKVASRSACRGRVYSDA
jgi:hypothetical protein